MVRRQHHIITATALAVALCAAAPAVARLDLNPVSGTPAQAPGPQVTNPWQGINAAHIANRAALTAAGAQAALPSGQSPKSEVVSGQGYTSPNAAPTNVVIAPSSNGFDWGDAAIGAGGALALTMLAAGGVFAATNGRRRGGRRSAQPTT
jgi:hypothetical protein